MTIASAPKAFASWTMRFVALRVPRMLAAASNPAFSTASLARRAISSCVVPLLLRRVEARVGKPHGGAPDADDDHDQDARARRARQLERLLQHGPGDRAPLRGDHEALDRERAGLGWGRCLAEHRPQPIEHGPASVAGDHRRRLGRLGVALVLRVLHLDAVPVEEHVAQEDRPPDEEVHLGVVPARGARSEATPRRARRTTRSRSTTQPGRVRCTS